MYSIIFYFFVLLINKYHYKGTIDGWAYLMQIGLIQLIDHLGQQNTISIHIFLLFSFFSFLW